MLALAVAWAGLCRLPQYRDTTTEFKWNGAFRTLPMIVSFPFSFFVYVSRTLKIIEMIVNTSSFIKVSFFLLLFFPYNEEDLHKHMHDWLSAVYFWTLPKMMMYFTVKMEQFLVKFLQFNLCFLLLIIMIQLLRSYAKSSTVPLYGVKRKISKLPVAISVTCVHLLWFFGSSKALLSGFDGHRSHWTRRIHQSVGSQSESICW